MVHLDRAFGQSITCRNPKLSLEGMSLLQLLVSLLVQAGRRRYRRTCVLQSAGMTIHLAVSLVQNAPVAHWCKAIHDTP